MKKFFLLLLPLFLLSLAPRTSVLIKTDIYTVNYSETYQQPLSVEYTVLCPNGTASRKGMDFYTNDSIITSDNADYENNVYDKGHMAPAADFTCSTEMLRKTFSYLMLRHSLAMYTLSAQRPLPSMLMQMLLVVRQSIHAALVNWQP